MFAPEGVLRELAEDTGGLFRTSPTTLAEVQSAFLATKAALTSSAAVLPETEAVPANSANSFEFAVDATMKELSIYANYVGTSSDVTFSLTGASGSVIGVNGFGTASNDQGVADVDDKIVSDIYYTNTGKYDVAPIQYQNLTGTELSTYALLQPAPYQSAQRRGQFVYSRYMDIANVEPLYAVNAVTTQNISSTNFVYFEHSLSYATFEGNDAQLLSPDGDANGSNFIWAGFG